jgi:hypothetical protein
MIQTGELLGLLELKLQSFESSHEESWWNWQWKGIGIEQQIFAREADPG